jgi:hypothetical protein
MMSNEQARAAIRSALAFWNEQLKAAETLQFDEVPEGFVAPVLLKRTYEEPDTGQRIFVGGLFLVSDNETRAAGVIDALRERLSPAPDDSP